MKTQDLIKQYNDIHKPYQDELREFLLDWAETTKGIVDIHEMWNPNETPSPARIMFNDTETEGGTLLFMLEAGKDTVQFVLMNNKEKKVEWEHELDHTQIPSTIAKSIVEIAKESAYEILNYTLQANIEAWKEQDDRFVKHIKEHSFEA